MTQAEALAKLDAMVLEATCGWGTACTAPITRAVSDWCRWMGATQVQREYPAIYFRRRHGRTRVIEGRVDVMAHWRRGNALAIEIDSANKRASRQKLERLHRIGARVLWLRWDARNRMPRPALFPSIPTHHLAIAEPQTDPLAPARRLLDGAP